MKILFIHTQYQFSGGEDSVVEKELALLKQFNDVEVLYLKNKGGWKGTLQFICSIWNVRTANEVKTKTLEFKPDIVHIHNWHFALGPLVFRIIKKLGIPIVHTVDNYRLLCPSAILLHKGKLFTDSLQSSFPWKAVRNKVYRSSFIITFWLAFIIWFHKKINTWQKIDLFICLTPFALELFQQSKLGVSKEKFFIKPNFTEPIALNENIKRKDHFLFVGRLSEEKGIMVLLKSFKDTPYFLRIAGDGPLKQNVLDFIKINNNVCYLGNLDNESVKLEIQKAQALIFTSICYEGMPMTILEAYSCSTPVIASNLGAMSSMIISGINGYYFEAGNDLDLKNVLKLFYDLPEQSKRILRNNAYKEYQDRYTPDQQIEYFNSVYKNL